MSRLMYQFKILLRNRTLLFWTFLFPLILATFFNMAFSDLMSNADFEPVRVGVVVVQEDKNFQNVLEQLSKADDKQVLSLQYISESEAEKQLIDESIEGYIVIDSEIKLFVKQNGLSQTIIRNIIDTYQQTMHTYQTILQENPNMLVQTLYEGAQSDYDYFQSQNVSAINTWTLPFYSLLGMICVYGAYWGLHVSTLVEANLSRQGSRVQVSPVSKMSLILIGNFVAFLIQYSSSLLLLVYLIQILGVSLGDQIGLICLILALGTYIGVLIGNVIGNMFKFSEDNKVGVVSTFAMSCSFLAGMMAPDIKYFVQEYVPFLGYINPVSVVTDALYALYYYPTYERFLFNVVLLVGMVIVLTGISIFSARRKIYDSL